MTKKISKPAGGRRAAAPVTASRRPRARGHALAPAHLGEAASAAVLAVAVLGLAVFIAGVAMAVSGLTIGNTFEDPPPNVAELGTGQILGGLGLSVFGIILAGSSLAVLAEIPRSRYVAAAASALAAVLAVIGIILVQAQPGEELVLSMALAISTLMFAVAAFILVRPRR